MAIKDAEILGREQGRMRGEGWCTYHRVGSCGLPIRLFRHLEYAAGPILLLALLYVLRYGHWPLLKKFGNFGVLNLMAQGRRRGFKDENCKIVFLGGHLYSFVHFTVGWIV